MNLSGPFLGLVAHAPTKLHIENKDAANNSKSSNNTTVVLVAAVATSAHSWTTMSDTEAVDGVSPCLEETQSVPTAATSTHNDQIDSVLHSVKSRLHAITGDLQASHLEHVQRLEEEHAAQRQAATEELRLQLADAHSTMERMKLVISTERNRTSHLAGAWHTAMSKKVRVGPAQTDNNALTTSLVQRDLHLLSTVFASWRNGAAAQKRIRKNTALARRHRAQVCDSCTRTHQPRKLTRVRSI